MQQTLRRSPLSLPCPPSRQRTRAACRRHGSRSPPSPSPHYAQRSAASIIPLSLHSHAHLQRTLACDLGRAHRLYVRRQCTIAACSAAENPGHPDRHRYARQRPHRGRIRIADRHHHRAVAAGHRRDRHRHRAGQAAALAELPAPGNLRRQRCCAPGHAARAVAGCGAGAGRRQALSHLLADQLQPVRRARFGTGRSELAADVGHRAHRGAA